MTEVKYLKHCIYINFSEPIRHLEEIFSTAHVIKFSI